LDNYWSDEKDVEKDYNYKAVFNFVFFKKISSLHIVTYFIGGGESLQII